MNTIYDRHYSMRVPRGIFVEALNSGTVVPSNAYNISNDIKHNFELNQQEIIIQSYLKKVIINKIIFQHGLSRDT